MIRSYGGKEFDQYELVLGTMRQGAFQKTQHLEARLRPDGVGPLAPVAPNKTEDGRAKNRRVELVEQ